MVAVGCGHEQGQDVLRGAGGACRLPIDLRGARRPAILSWTAAYRLCRCSGNRRCRGNRGGRLATVIALPGTAPRRLDPCGYSSDRRSPDGIRSGYGDDLLVRRELSCRLANPLRNSARDTGCSTSGRSGISTASITRQPNSRYLRAIAATRRNMLLSRSCSRGRLASLQFRLLPWRH